MDLELRGRSALVSGSSSDLGEAIALELAAEGWRCGRPWTRPRAHGSDGARSGGAWCSHAVTFGDLADGAAADQIAADALAAFGAIDGGMAKYI